MNYTIIDTLSLSLPISDFRKFYNSDIVRVFTASACDYQPQVTDRYGFFNRNADNLHSGDFVDWHGAAELLPQEFWENLILSFLENLTGCQWDLSKIRLGMGKNGFQNSAIFEGGFIAWGGNNTVYQSDGEPKKVAERVQIYFDSKGCEKITENNCIKDIYKFLVNSDDGRITRLDIALDCLNGEFSIKDALDAFYSGKFQPTHAGARPKAKYIQSLGENSDGETVYVGSRQSGKMLRAYEKGKQLGHADSNWLRVEVEYLRKDRHISFESLLLIDQAFAESYPWSAEILAEMMKKDITMQEGKLIQVSKTKEKIALDHLIKHGQRAYGKLVNELFKVWGDLDVPLSSVALRICEALRLQGRPSRLLAA